MSGGKNIAFIGLGVMGGPMAKHLVRAGHTVTVYNRTASRAAQWLAEIEAEGFSGAVAPTPADAAEASEIIITCVGNDEDLEEVLRGPQGAFRAGEEHRLFIDHTTVSANLARSLAAEADRSDFQILDAPISGGQAGAKKGALAIMCGGHADAFARAEPVMQAYGARIVHVGDAGAGQTTKMANQMCIAGILGGLSEAIRLVQASDVDADKVLEAISGGAAQSWQMENRWQTMVDGEFDFGFAVDWMRKDLDYALKEAGSLGLESPVTTMVDGFYEQIQTMGGGRQDTSSLIRRLPYPSQKSEEKS